MVGHKHDCKCSLCRLEGRILKAYRFVHLNGIGKDIEATIENYENKRELRAYLLHLAEEQYVRLNTNPRVTREQLRNKIK